jgi:hypothetical protein
LFRLEASFIRESKTETKIFRINEIGITSKPTDKVAGLNPLHNLVNSVRPVKNAPLKTETKTLRINEIGKTLFS